MRTACQNTGKKIIAMSDILNVTFVFVFFSLQIFELRANSQAKFQHLTLVLSTDRSSEKHMVCVTLSPSSVHSSSNVHCGQKNSFFRFVTPKTLLLHSITQSNMVRCLSLCATHEDSNCGWQLFFCSTNGSLFKSISLMQY